MVFLLKFEILYNTIKINLPKLKIDLENILKEIKKNN